MDNLESKNRKLGILCADGIGNRISAGISDVLVHQRLRLVSKHFAATFGNRRLRRLRLAIPRRLDRDSPALQLTSQSGVFSSELRRLKIRGPKTPLTLSLLQDAVLAAPEALRSLSFVAREGEEGVWEVSQPHLGPLLHSLPLRSFACRSDHQALGRDLVEGLKCLELFLHFDGYADGLGELNKVQSLPRLAQLTLHFYGFVHFPISYLLDTIGFQRFTGLRRLGLVFSHCFFTVGGPETSPLAAALANIPSLHTLALEGISAYEVPNLARLTNLHHLSLGMENGAACNEAELSELILCLSLPRTSLRSLALHVSLESGKPPHWPTYTTVIPVAPFPLLLRLRLSGYLRAFARLAGRGSHIWPDLAHCQIAHHRLTDVGDFDRVLQEHVMHKTESDTHSAPIQAVKAGPVFVGGATGPEPVFWGMNATPY